MENRRWLAKATSGNPRRTRKTSIGVVGDPALRFTGRGDDPLATFEEEIERCPGIAQRLATATRISGAYVTSDFSYHSRRMAGEGWVLVGDAFGFVDPVYSAGVMLAMKSAEFAADVVGRATGEWHGPLLSGYGVHLVYIHDRIEPPMPAFEAVEDQLRQDWVNERRREMADTFFTELLDSYEVVIEQPDEASRAAADELR